MTGPVIAVLGVIVLAALIGTLMASGRVPGASASPQPQVRDPSELEREIYAELYGGRTGMVRSVRRPVGPQTPIVARDQRPALAHPDLAPAPVQPGPALQHGELAPSG